VGGFQFCSGGTQAFRCGHGGAMCAQCNGNMQCVDGGCL
jgi:hypothetical protein